MAWIKFMLLAVLFQFCLTNVDANFDNQNACVNPGGKTEVNLSCNNGEDTYFIITQANRYMSNTPCSSSSNQQGSTCQDTDSGNREFTSDLRTKCNTKTTCSFTAYYNHKITSCDQEIDELPYMYMNIEYICYPSKTGGISTPSYNTFPVTVTSGSTFHLMNTDYPNWSEFEEIRCDISIPSIKGVVAGFYIYDMETEDDDLNAQYCFVWSVDTREESKCNIKGFFQSLINTDKGHIAIRQLSEKANSARFFIFLFGNDINTYKVTEWPAGTNITCYLESQSEGLIASLTTICISCLMSLLFALH